MSTFGANLKAARLAADVTQHEMATHFGITRGAVAQWEAGTIYPDASRLADIAEYLDCSLDVLFRGKVEAANEPTALPTFGKFWMVYGAGQRQPVYRHYSEDAAKTEALRLAKAHPEILFVVLEATSAFRAERPAVQEYITGRDPDDDIPF